MYLMKALLAIVLVTMLADPALAAKKSGTFGPGTIGCSIKRWAVLKEVTGDWNPAYCWDREGSKWTLISTDEDNGVAKVRLDKKLLDGTALEVWVSYYRVMFD